MPAATTAPHQVCNLALSYVGNGQTIDSLDEETLEAKQSKLHFAPTRDELLEAFPWRFATRRATLAVLSETRSGWDFVYALPTDLLAAQRIWNGLDPSPPELEVPFELEATGVAGVTGRCLLTNQSEAQLIYTAECPTVALWTPTFVQAVAWALAVKLALVVPVKPQLAALAEGKAAQALRAARAAQLNGRRGGPAPLSSITTSRG